MTSQYIFLWANTQSAITIECNVESFKKYKDIPWNNVDNIIEFARDNKIQCFHSKDDLKKDAEFGKNYFNEEFAKSFLSNIYLVCKKHLILFNELRNIDYSKLSDEKLFEIFNRVIDQWKHTISYFRGLQEEGTRQLIEKIRKSVSAEEFNILILPSELDEVNKEQIDWQKILESSYSEKAILDHCYKYPWLAAYHFTMKDVIKTLKNKYEYDESNKKYRNIIKDKENLRKRQEIILQNNPKIRKLVKLAQDMAITRVLLKSYWGGTDFYLVPIYAEISKRSKEKVSDIIKYYLSYEVKDLLLSKKKLTNDEKKRRKQCFAVLWKDGKAIFKSGNEAEELIRKELGDLISISKDNKLIGQIANEGYIKGVARILDANDTSKANILRKTFKQGEILITQMTQPNVMDIASKAGALVTDEGGMLSHAAIISRELKIPCIVGTQKATQVFKDGDLIEVDANKGIVRKIKK